MTSKAIKVHTTTATTCPYCGVGCGVLATTKEDGTVSVTGDLEHPANFGRLCSKGAALHETLSLEGRLLAPHLFGKMVDWETALEFAASQFIDCINTHGAESVAFYLSGQLLTEDYYVANKLMKGFIGTANIDTNSRLCMASTVAGHKRAFGTDTVPGCYEDLTCADLIVLVGSNLAWCHPVLYQRIMAAQESRPEMKLVVIDPRKTATSDLDCHHLPIAPGSDVALFNGLLSFLEKNGAVEQNYVDAHTTGVRGACKAAGKQGLSTIANITGLPEQEILQFYHSFLGTERVVTVYSQGVNQSSSGTDKVNAIINCHLITGRIGKPGCGPFSVTGQPNAMGGREVGGLSNQLASHLSLENLEHRNALQKFWKAPKMANKPGLKAVELFEAVKAGKIKALWIMGTNPVDSLPEADTVRSALETCPFVVISDVVLKTDTTAYADLLLPAAAWGEKDGTVTNSERRISRQRAFLPLPGVTKPDWWITSEVAKRMGFRDAFCYTGPADIFDEYTRSTGLVQSDKRDLDLTGISNVDEAAYDAMSPVMWPVKKRCKAGKPSFEKNYRFFAKGHFFTEDGKARFIPTPYRKPQTSPSKEYPLILNTGRVRDQWHTMTRTSLSARLMAHIGEPFAELHPEDAENFAIEGASLLKVTSSHGSIIARAVITDRQLKGSVFVPMHWTDQFTAKGRVDCVVSSQTDPVSGQPESKFTPIAISPFRASWYGFAVLREKPNSLTPEYWAAAKAKGGWSLELAGLQKPDDCSAFAEKLFCCEDGALNQNNNDRALVYNDPTKGHIRIALFEDNQLKAALFVACEPVTVSRIWARDLLTMNFETTAQRLAVLAAGPGEGQPDRGAIVCSCFSVGLNQITNAVVKDHCQTVNELGAMLNAGTNCGSCRPEIRRIIDEALSSQIGQNRKC